MVGKIDLESMLDESGFSTTTEMGGFTLERPRRILGTRNVLGIHLRVIIIGWRFC